MEAWYNKGVHFVKFDQYPMTPQIHPLPDSYKDWYLITMVAINEFEIWKRTACRDNFFYRERGIFPEKQGKGQKRGINLNLLKFFVTDVGQSDE